MLFFNSPLFLWGRNTEEPGVAPERGACWPAPLKPIRFLLPGWRQAYPGGRREHICHHPAPRLAVLGSGWGSRFTLWQPLSPLPRRVYLALFSLIKQQNNPHVTRLRDEVVFLLLGKVIPMPGHHSQPLVCTATPSRFVIRASQPGAESKNHLLFKNTEREKLSSGFLEILRQKNKHSSWKSVVVLKASFLNQPRNCCTK